MFSAPQKRFMANGRSTLTVTALILSPRPAEFFVELLGLNLADRRVERRDDADDRRLPFEVGRGHFLQAPFVVGELEIGGGLADLHGLAGQRERIAFERNGGGATHSDIPIREMNG